MSGVGFERRAAGAVGDEAGACRGECCSGCRKGSVDIARARKRAHFSGALVIAVVLATAGAASAGATRATIAVCCHRGVVKPCRIRAVAYADLNF